MARDRITDLILGHLGNDLIVPDVGVYAKNGAAAFPIADPLTLAAQQSVDHFSYWGCPAVHGKLIQWLELFHVRIRHTLVRSWVRQANPAEAVRHDAYLPAQRPLSA